jgi:hypothetical protein
MEKHVEAHQASSWHRSELLSSEICGCFYCLAIFKPDEITEWCDWQKPEIGAEKIGNTAICPNCSIDSVVHSNSGYPITKEFLTKMNRYWF